MLITKVAFTIVAIVAVTHAAVFTRGETQDNKYDGKNDIKDKDSNKANDYKDGKYPSTVVYYKAEPTNAKYGGKDNYTSTTIWYAPQETGKSNYKGKYQDNDSGNDTTKYHGKESNKNSYQDALDKHQKDVEAQLNNTQEYKNAIANSADKNKN